MASEKPRIVGTETDEEKKRREGMQQNNIADSAINKVITNELLEDFLRSDEFKLNKSKNGVSGEFGFLPAPNDQAVCNLTFFPSNKGPYKPIIVSLLSPETTNKDQKPLGKTLHVQTAGEDEESLTMMIFTLAESLKKFNPNSLEVKLKPINANAKKIMEDACKKYGLKVVETFSSERKASEPGATLKMDKPGDDASRPRLVGK